VSCIWVESCSLAEYEVELIGLVVFECFCEGEVDCGGWDKLPVDVSWSGGIPEELSVRAISLTDGTWLRESAQRAWE